MLVSIRRFQKRTLVFGDVVAPGVGSGTTLLLTDIQESTQIWERLPVKVAAEAISLHHQIIRRCAVRHRGYECGTEGDAFILAFHSAIDATRFAIDAQSQLVQAPWPKELFNLEVCKPQWTTMAPETSRLLHERRSGFDSVEEMVEQKPESIPQEQGMLEGTLNDISNTSESMFQRFKKRVKSLHNAFLRKLVGGSAQEDFASDILIDVAQLRTQRTLLREITGVPIIDTALAFCLRTDLSLEWSTLSARLPALFPNQSVETATSQSSAGRGGDVRSAARSSIALHFGTGRDLDKKIHPEELGIEGLLEEVGFDASPLGHSVDMLRFHGPVAESVAPPSGFQYNLPELGDVPSQEESPISSPGVLDDKSVCIEEILSTPNLLVGQQLASTLPGADGHGPGKLLLHRGLRVRMGLASGVHEKEHIQLNRELGRTKYGGPLMLAAKAVSDAAQGGMVLIDASAFEQLPINLRQREFLVSSMGEHVLPGLQDAPQQLYQALPWNLVHRLAHSGPIRSIAAQSPDILQAPFGKAAVCFMFIPSYPLLKHWNPDITARAAKVFEDVVKTLLERYGGYLLESGGGRFLTAFTRPDPAIRWALESVHECMLADWPGELLEHELGEEHTLKAMKPLRSVLHPSLPGSEKTASFCQSPSSIPRGAASLGGSFLGDESTDDASGNVVANRSRACSTLETLFSGQKNLVDEGVHEQMDGEQQQQQQQWRQQEESKRSQGAAATKNSFGLAPGAHDDLSGIEKSASMRMPNSDCNRSTFVASNRALEDAAPHAFLRRDRRVAQPRCGRNSTFHFQKLLFRGLRIKVGIDYGTVTTDIHAATARAALRGKTMNRASHIAGAAKSGQVWCSENVWNEAALEINSYDACGPLDSEPGRAAFKKQLRCSLTNRQRQVGSAAKPDVVAWGRGGFEFSGMTEKLELMECMHAIS